MTSPVISVEHLSKQYDLGVISTGTLTRDLERWWARLRGQPDPYTRIGQKDAFEQMGESILALDDVSFKVEQGEALGIIGKNGAGKSTLLKILSRVTAPTSGVVKVRGRIGSLLEVGTGFHPELTGRENVYLNGAILGMKKAEVARKFDEIVDFSGVEKFIDTPVKRYSSGMYVRLAFAVAAHLDPEILIVDEVLAVGDAEFQKKCLGKMGDVAGEGRTVLFVSHNMDAIRNLCPKSILLKNGKIQLIDKSDSVVMTYLERMATNDYVANETRLEDIQIKQIWLSSTDGVKKDKFLNGEPVVVNALIINPKNEEIEFELSFWDTKGLKLWNFTHHEHNIPPIIKGPKINVRITFYVPKINCMEVFIHAGIHKTGKIGPHYTELITDKIRYFIEDRNLSKNESSGTIIKCPIEFWLTD